MGLLLRNPLVAFNFQVVMGGLLLLVLDKVLPLMAPALPPD
jgi:hypothetical protein